MEARVSMTWIAVILLQLHPERVQEWAPVETWGRCLEALEQSDNRVLLEL